MYAITVIFLIAIGVVYLMTRPRARKPVLDPKEFRDFPLIKKTVISHNTAVYRFALPQSTDVLGLPIGHHIRVRAHIDGKDVVRSYTPISSDDDAQGYFDVLIKTYPEGRISKVFSELTLGDTISVSGPKGRFEYRPNAYSALGFIAGGTGISPVVAIVKAVLKNPADKTHLSLIFANVNEEDILLRQELDELQAAHDNLTVHYVLNNPPEKWNGSVGFVSEDMIRKHLPAPAADVKVLMCGPPPMMAAMGKHCEAIGFDKPRTVSKAEDQVFMF
ncbi:NADH-cytochrome b5 reductase [Tieghemiomyces parasiticus]|uniref:NADH-cytochrome b5 reductase n=1 Tax=Tieghemiomyces parasiticus TaxID=78921 RepID=A0A9W8ADM4_9FUNG|nr:NADH-cytochrome b5 reductase [Tieghemiomyces parasiticus]